MSKSTHRLFMLGAIAVAVALAWRWWTQHSARTVASSDDPLLTKLADSIAPQLAPQLGKLGGGVPLGRVQNWDPIQPPALSADAPPLPVESPALAPPVLGLRNGIGGPTSGFIAPPVSVNN